MAVCAAALAQQLSKSTHSVRVVRWSFGRGDEVLVCELGLDAAEAIYELTTIVPWGPRSSVERFPDVHAAVQRQAAIERLLIEEGWSLDRFETTDILR